MTISAVVTGASSGIGLAVAERLLRGGHSVVLNARDEDNLEAAASRLRSLGELAVVAGDAADDQAVDRMVEAAKQLGTWGIAVANAGGGEAAAPLAELDAASMLQRYQSNAVSTGLLLAAAARDMADHGRFVAVASVAARRGSLSAGADYSAAKGAVLSLVRHAARELAARGVTVNAVAPGFIDVPRIQRRLAALSEGERAAVLDAIPLGRPGTPQEVAAAVCFLTSSDAGYITGATLDINGGLHTT